MKLITEQLSEILEKAFTNAGYDAKHAQAVISGRPDLCQSNAMEPCQMPDCLKNYQW